MTVMRINVGPIHPSTHGVLRLVVDVDGDTVRNVETHIGFLHRGVEKLMETRMYMQSPSYVEKLDYAAPMGWSALYTNTVEMAVGKEATEEAQYASVILLEFQRIASHLLWLGTFCNDTGQMFTMFMWAMRERDQILKFLEDVTGSRMFYVNFRIGGLNRRLPQDFYSRARELTDYLERHITEYPEILDGNSIFMERTKGVGVLSRADAIAYGVSGPVLRGSGVEEDVRKSAPYYAYKKLNFKIPTSGQGDSYSRYRVRYEEMHQSISIIRQALEKMPKEGNVLGMPIKLIGPPARQEPVLNRHELARGEGLIYMVPTSQKPYRIYLRSPAYTNLSVLAKMCEGVKYADIFPILGSIDVVIAEIDK